MILVFLCLCREIFLEPFCQNGERLQYTEGSGLDLAISRQLVMEESISVLLYRLSDLQKVFN